MIRLSSGDVTSLAAGAGLTGGGDNGDVSMHIDLDISTVSGHVNLGGIDQPIIGQRKISHDIRMHEGEINLLGGINVTRSVLLTLSNNPSSIRLPLMVPEVCPLGITSGPAVTPL